MFSVGYINLSWFGFKYGTGIGFTIMVKDNGFSST